ncbi:major facilitator superfamily domain-containing protein [Aspergillus recurvatus]
MSILPHLAVNSYNLTVVVLVAIGTVSTVYGLAVIGSTVGQPNFYSYFALEADTTAPSYKHTTNMIGALNGINSAGAFMGCILQAWSADAYGRKATIRWGAAVLILGGALCAGAVHMAMFLVGRFVAGLGAGILACIVPIYQVEVSTAETRGAMVCVTGVMYAFSWRFPLAFQVLFPLCVLVGAPFIAKSPRWLLEKGKGGEALSVLQKLHSTNETNNSTQAREELGLMEKQLEDDRSHLVQSRGPALSLFSTPANRKRSLIATILMIGNQLLGTFVLTNYGVLIYASLGLTGSIPLLLNACWTSFTLIGNTWTALYIDRLGRRRFLLAGATGCTLCMVFLCALTAPFLNTDNTPGLRAAVFFIFFYIFWWCFFVDATQFAYIAEIFPNHLRSQGVALGLGWFYLSSEVTLVVAPVGLDRVGWRFYLVLIVPSILYIGCIYFLFPETKGRTLEEMGRVFGEEPVYSQEAGESDNGIEKGIEKGIETQRIEDVSPV